MTWRGAYGGPLTRSSAAGLADEGLTDNGLPDQRDSADESLRELDGGATSLNREHDAQRVETRRASRRPTAGHPEQEDCFSR
jgi:hypothetical protein